MSDLKRRKLGENKKNNRGPQNQGQNQQNQNQSQNRNQQRRPQPQGQQQGQQSQQQAQRNPQQQNRRPQQRQAPKQAPRPPPPPPAYLQRDLLLVATADSSKGIEEVRAKFDPLSKKIPAHVTLLYPEPSKLIPPEFLKNLNLAELPSLRVLSFSRVTVHDEMYLWLVPDEESHKKLSTWREALMGALTSSPDSAPHSQEEEFNPHLTLGYVPRSLTPEDAVAFAQNLITLPAEVNFAKILLEEFSENQISNSVDAVILASPTV